MRDSPHCLISEDFGFGHGQEETNNVVFDQLSATVLGHWPTPFCCLLRFSCGSKETEIPTEVGLWRAVPEVGSFCVESIGKPSAGPDCFVIKYFENCLVAPSILSWCPAPVLEMVVLLSVGFWIGISGPFGKYRNLQMKES